MRRIVQVPGVCESQPIFEATSLKVIDVARMDWKEVDERKKDDWSVSREEWEYAQQWIQDNSQWEDEEFTSGFRDGIRLVMSDIEFYKTKNFTSFSIGVNDSRFWLGFGTGIRFGQMHAETFKEQVRNSNSS